MDGSKEKRTRVLLSEGGTSMRQLVRTHRLVWVRHPKQSQLSSSPDFIPIASVNKVEVSRIPTMLASVKESHPLFRV